jgi:hypothetical protein
MSDSQQSKRGEEVQHNPPVEGTEPAERQREDVLARTDSEQAIPLPSQDTPTEVVEEGGNPVARLIQRWRRSS